MSALAQGFAELTQYVSDPKAASDKATAANALIRFQQLRRWLEDRLEARQLAIRALLASAIAFEPVLLVGPPGTAKGALAALFADGINARRLPARPDELQLPLRRGFFDVQLTATTDVDELMGPIDLTALRQGRWRRVVHGTMPHSVVVFVDEVFRGSGAVLNSLLRLLNEREYTDAGVAYRADSLVIVGACNEVKNRREFEAFYSRFPLRVACPGVAWSVEDRDPTRPPLADGPVAPLPTSSGQEETDKRKRLLRLLRKAAELEDQRCAKMLEIPRERSWIGPKPEDFDLMADGGDTAGTGPANLLDLILLHRYVREIAWAWATGMSRVGALPLPAWTPEQYVGIYDTLTGQQRASGGATPKWGPDRYRANDRTFGRLPRILIADNLLRGRLVPPGKHRVSLQSPEEYLKDLKHDLDLLVCIAEQPPDPAMNEDGEPGYFGDFDEAISHLDRSLR